MKFNPNNAKINSDFGLALKDKQKLEAVVENHQKAFELKPNYPEPDNGLGNIFLELGKLTESQFGVAIEHYQKGNLKLAKKICHKI
ncbi:hypothetical protein [Okeania sp. KiyG1]|uniref:hypothetical protein n=1 Tax=Okeania sp. KiyG1 TaxID=2720165 RepID=UPI001920899C|nr:hypothetical protein [Okeania sp. KiyG1]GGA05093.1 hypothetical protein CYANOKiyG1_17400 [Okeania sp. KiyG1]